MIVASVLQIAKFVARFAAQQDEFRDQDTRTGRYFERVGAITSTTGG
jgi:hypothetical protein